MSDEKFAALAMPFLKKSKAYGKYSDEKLLKILKPRVEVLEDIPSKIDFWKSMRNLIRHCISIRR